MTTESGSSHPILKKAAQFERDGRYDSALVYFDRARSDFAADENWAEHVRTSVQMGRCALEFGRHDLAATYLDSALQSGRLHLGSGHPGLGEVYIYLGRLSASLSEYDRAFDSFRKALDLLLGGTGEEGPVIAELYHNLAVAYRATGDYNRASVYFDKAMRIRLAYFGDTHPAVAQTYSGLASLYAHEGEYERAVEIAQKALQINRTAYGHRHPEIAKNLQILGNTYRLQGEYQRAFRALNEGYDIAFGAFGEQHPSVAQILNNLGIVYEETGDYEEAIVALERSLGISIKLYGLQHADVAVTKGNLGWIYTLIADYDRAINMLQSARQINVDLFGEVHLNVAISLRCLGTTFRLRGDYNSAFESLQKALAIALDTVGEHHLQVATILNDLGIVYIVSGDPNRALTYYDRSLRISRSISGDEHLDVAATYNNLGNAYSAMGDYDRAVEMLENAQRIKQNIFGERHPRIATSMNNLGRVYSDKGEFEKARLYYRRSLEVFLEVYGERHPYVANQYNALAAVSTKLGDPRKALDLYRKAIHITVVSSGENNPYVAGGYSALGSTYEALGEYERAEYFFQKALSHRLSTLGSSHPMVAESYNDIGEFHRKKESYDEALASFEDAICANVAADACAVPVGGHQSSRVLSEPDLLISLWGKARSLAARAEFHENAAVGLEASLQTYLRASESIDRMRRSIVTEGSKLHWSKTVAPLLAGAIKVAVELYEITGEDEYKATAFYFAEKGKATLLLESFSEVSARQIVGIPDSLLEQERRLYAEVMGHEQRLREIPGGEVGLTEERNRRERQVFELKRRREALIALLEHDYPDYYDLKYNLRVARPEEIQRVELDDKTAIIEYVLGEEEVFVFILTSENIHVKALPRDPKLEEQIAELRRGIVEQDYRLYTSYAHNLYVQLLEFAIDDIQASNLVIIPDGVLNYVPFEALLIRNVDSPLSTKDYRLLPYLIKSFDVSYAYSASLRIETSRRSRPTPPRDYIAFAPVFRGGLPVASWSADLFKDNGKIDSVDVEARLGYLARTRDEVTDIQKLFRRRYGLFQRFLSRKTQVYLEEDATEDRLKTVALDEYKYVHFATHGFVNQKNPAASGIVLYPNRDSSERRRGEAEGTNEDGVLRLDEVYNLKLNADLVVLSACETGLGPIARGEGVLGLTRGFLYAGSSNVLVSLWKADDIQTSELMPDFYRSILEGVNMASALRRAKLRQIQSNSRYARPFYWAPFVLVGS